MSPDGVPPNIDATKRAWAMSEKRAALEEELNDWLTLAEDIETEWLSGEISQGDYEVSMFKAEAEIESIQRELEQ